MGIIEDLWYLYNGILRERTNMHWRSAQKFLNIDLCSACSEEWYSLIVKSLNQTIVTGGDKLGHPLHNWLTIHPNQFQRGCSKFSSLGGVTSMRWHVNGWQFFSASQWYWIWKHQTGNFICPCICCQVHDFEKYPDTLLNTMIKYNINKHSGPLFQKSNVSLPPGW